MSLQFFTDITTEASSLCLLHVDKYKDPRKARKKVVFVDPGVYQLAKGAKEYKNIDLLHELASGGLRENEWVSIDYPCDMNLDLQDLFVKKSVDNNIKYADNIKYICTIQNKFSDIQDFIARFREIEYIWQENPKKVIGLGNLCRIMRPTPYLEHAFEFVHRNLPVDTRIHVYGPALAVIKWYFPRLCRRFQVSADSTKWTRALTSGFKWHHGLNARKHNRDLFFTTYVRYIERATGLQVDF